MSLIFDQVLIKVFIVDSQLTLDFQAVCRLFLRVSQTSSYHKIVSDECNWSSNTHSWFRPANLDYDWFSVRATRLWQKQGSNPWSQAQKYADYNPIGCHSETKNRFQEKLLFWLIFFFILYFLVVGLYICCTINIWKLERCSILLRASSFKVPEVSLMS